MNTSQFWYGTSGGDLGDKINQSLRFNGTNTFLSRAITADSAGTTSTFSFWIKFAREKDDVTDTVWSYGGSSYFQYPLTKVLRASGGSDSDWTSKARDFNAWYHIVMQGNGNTDATNNKMWVNGREISTEFNTRSFPGLTGGSTFRIGDNTNGDQHFMGYIADFICVAGSAVNPVDNFGRYNEDNVWVPKNYTGSYGAKGFRLKFDPNGVAGQSGDGAGIGADHSGNNNHFTPSGFTTTAISTSNFENDVNYADTPTNNHATFTPLVKPQGQGVYPGADANLGFAASSNGTFSTTTASQRVDTGKWYFEVKDNAGEIGVGVIDEGWNSFNTWESKYPGSATTSLALGYKTNNGQKWENGSGSSYGSSGSAGDVYGIAWDADTGTIWVHKNGTWANSATQSEVEAGTTTNAMFTGKTTGKKWRFAVSQATTGSGAEINFGQRDFAYTVPSGYKTICTDNQPDPSITDGREHFGVVKYTGGSSTVAETGLLFQPDLIWFKSYSHATEHALFDSVRGTAAGYLNSMQTDAEATTNAALTSFNSNGFTVSAPTGGEWNNGGGRTYMAWAWKAGGAPTQTNSVAAGSAQTAGSVKVDGDNGSFAHGTLKVDKMSVNTEAGFSIIGYTGTATNGTLPHGLNSTPEIIVVKGRDTADQWHVKHKDLGTENQSVRFNSDAAQADFSVWQNTAPTSTVFSIGTQDGVNKNNDEFIAYCWHSVAGYSQIGEYRGTGGATNTFVETGFKPAFVLIKCYSNAANWGIYDNARSPSNPCDDVIRANLSNANDQPSQHAIDFVANGFSVKGLSVNVGESYWYIYMAFAEHPFGGGTKVPPATAR